MWGDQPSQGDQQRPPQGRGGSQTGGPPRGGQQHTRGGGQFGQRGGPQGGRTGRGRFIQRYHPRGRLSGMGKNVKSVFLFVPLFLSNLPKSLKNLTSEGGMCCMSLFLVAQCHVVEIELVVA